MAISDLTPISPTSSPADTDLFWGEQGGNDYKFTRAEIVAKVAADLATEIANTKAERDTLTAEKVERDGSIPMTGALTLAGAPTSSLHATTKTYVDSADALKANISSPTFTGVPAAPTAADGTSTTQLATTAFVLNQIDEYLFERTPVTTASKTLSEDEAGYVGVDFAGAVSITLPEISSLTNSNRVFYKIKDEGFNANATTQVITINRAGSDTIENGATSVTITTAGEDVILYNDGGTAWYLSSPDTLASETAKGVVEIATQAEAEALTDTERVITPATLANVLDKEVYKTTELGASSKVMAESDSGTWYVTYTSTGSVSITLPDPTTLTDSTKTVYEIVDAASASINNITITSGGSATLDGENSLVINANKAGMKLFTDGTNWLTTANTQNAIETAAAAASGSGTAFGAATTSGVTSALPTSEYRIRLTSTSSSDVASLPDGTNGQKVFIAYVAEGASGDKITVTPDNLLGYTTLTFNDIGDTVELMYDSTSAAWFIVSVFNTTVA
jgi:hypothetical protein